MSLNQENPDDLPPEIHAAQIAGIQSQIAELDTQLVEYEQVELHQEEKKMCENSNPMLGRAEKSRAMPNEYKCPDCVERPDPIEKPLPRLCLGSAEEKLSDMVIELNALEEKAAYLHHLVDRISERLLPITKEVPTECKPAGGESQPSTEICRRIRNIAGLVETSISNLQDTLDRIDI